MRGGHRRVVDGGVRWGHWSFWLARLHLHARRCQTEARAASNASARRGRQQEGGGGACYSEHGQSWNRQSILDEGRTTQGRDEPAKEALRVAQTARSHEQGRHWSCAHRSPMFQRVGGFGSDRLEQTRTGTKPRPSAGRKCNLSVPSASPGARSCYWAWSGCGGMFFVCQRTRFRPVFRRPSCPAACGRSRGLS